MAPPSDDAEAAVTVQKRANARKGIPNKKVGLSLTLNRTLSVGVPHHKMLSPKERYGCIFDEGL